MSGFWIIVANSWMQTPAGYEIQGDKAVLTDFFAALFNPSVLPRFTHTIFSSWALAGFIVMAVSAWYVRKGRAGDVSRLTLRVGLIVAIVGTLAVLGTGDTSSRQVAETQPTKFAAMQGLYSTTSARAPGDLVAAHRRRIRPTRSKARRSRSRTCSRS